MSNGRLQELRLVLPLVLHELWLKDKLEVVYRYLQDLGPGFQKVKPRYADGLLSLALEENGLLDPVPAQRMSDGTLRFLCLLAILLDPDPPPLVCIEEPEVGLHPDAMQVVAKAMLEASEHMQLVVTTHSDHLVNALTSNPEAVMVCEKGDDHATRLRRLGSAELDTWLDDFQLGDLWRRGEIGGNRW